MLLGASWLCTSKGPQKPSKGEEEERGGRREGADMDESSLLDLLECSVCLERLDTTARVLPCQHTFCRRCLQSIVSSRNELRCPECRILVECGVDDLPANILLVRLLDGIRQRPRNSPTGSPTAGGHHCAGSNNSNNHSPGCSATGGTAGTPCTPNLRELAAASQNALLLAKNISQLPCGKALYAYEGKEPGDLKFNKGDIIILRRKVDENWYHGELNGNRGFFPASYIQCIKPLSQPPPQGKALYDFEIKDKDQDKDCLTFTKDEILTVIRRVDDNWAEGMLGDKIGIFPILYVELNEAAKQLIEKDKTSLSSAPGYEVPVSVDANMVHSVTQSPILNNTGVVSANQRHVNIKKNAKKRHSFTALSMTHKSSHAMNNRHSMEISAPVLISSSDPRAAARIGGMTQLSSSAPVQDSSSFGSTAGAGAASPKTGTLIGEQGSSPKVQLPLNVYLALYAYKPQKNDELELRKGEMYRVTEKCQDGWFKGTSLRNGASGVFPGNYVTPVSRMPAGFAQSRNCTMGVPLASRSSPLASHASPGGMTNCTNVVRPVLPITVPQIHAHQSPTSSQNNSPKISNQQAINHTRTSVQMAHPSAQPQERPTATVSPIRTHSSPSRLPASPNRPQSTVSPQHMSQQHSSVQTSVAAHCPRPIIPLTSTAAAITPPNVTATSIYAETNGPVNCTPTSSPTNNGCKTEDRKTEKREKKGGLLKLLAGASAKKKSRSPPSISPTHDPQAMVEGVIQGAVGLELSMINHGRAGSCPIESEMQGAMGMHPLHRKTGSLDLNFSIPSPVRQPTCAMVAVRPEPKSLSRERYRVVVPYPPQSEAEIELKEGDIVFVHKKREDGWYKGTLQRNGRTGLFPGSFVESF
ncbi:E3 ubiquitin-protein ligase SH3RF3 isoform X2 [Hyla sarda]|uniref:E3 ubiquitin-protein ligase SH3RF3 isoform X2 n=1 Tax=Hyla sarda TaxID=327740 RepID=UPI0024C2717D|nr:E3 ubiquitin-protein ligase SH3RF3 isoform X2 [Hyla sarda]